MQWLLQQLSKLNRRRNCKKNRRISKSWGDAVANRATPYMVQSNSGPKTKPERPQMRFSSKTNNRRNSVLGKFSRGSRRPEKTLRTEDFPKKGEVHAVYPVSSTILLQKLLKGKLGYFHDWHVLIFIVQNTILYYCPPIMLAIYIYCIAFYSNLPYITAIYWRFSFAIEPL